jgi:hypothetical protein
VSDEDYVSNKRPDRLYFSKSITVSSQGQPRAGRYASRVLEAADREHFADIQGEVLLRVTQSGREQIKAFFFVDDRKIRTLALQRFSAATGRPHEQAHFCLRGDEIRKLLDLALLIRTSQFSDEGKVRLEEGDLEQFSLSRDAVRTLLRTDTKLLAEVLEHEITERDIVAVAYRREQLRKFERLLHDDAFFATERARLQCRGDEPVWQAFFEANPWIFGYGLFYVFTSGYDEARLEQTVAGAQVGSAGKRADALLRTRGLVSSLCFVEIKTHRTALLEQTAHRPGTWAPSTELVKAVAQAQRTVDSAERALERRLIARDESGNPTGEQTFLIRPRSVVVAGTLQEFVAPAGVNEPRFTSFELYRRQLVAPEVITFDELHQRARFIVDSSAQDAP